MGDTQLWGYLSRHGLLSTEAHIYRGGAAGNKQANKITSEITEAYDKTLTG